MGHTSREPGHRIQVPVSSSYVWCIGGKVEITDLRLLPYDISRHRPTYYKPLNIGLIATGHWEWTCGVIKCLQNEINPLDGTKARAKVPLVSVYMARVVGD